MTSPPASPPPAPGGLLWRRELTGARPWYHYAGPRGQSRFLSAFNLKPAVTAVHTWELTDQAPVWTALRCVSCGDRSPPGFGLSSSLPPPWCPRCGSGSPWLPVTEEPLLTITWFRFECARCRRPCLIGNDPAPEQCVRCLAYDSLAARPPLPVPTATPIWSPALHSIFPPPFRLLVRTLLLANVSACAAGLPCGLPCDLLLHTLPFVAPLAHPNPSGPGAGDSDSDSEGGFAEGLSSIGSGSGSQSLDTDPSWGLVTPTSCVSVWRP